MKKILLGIAAALVLAACSENKQQETTEAVDTAYGRIRTLSSAVKLWARYWLAASTHPTA